MSIIELPYGKTHLTVNVPYACEKVSILEQPLDHTDVEAVEQALNHPIGASINTFRGAKSVVIATSDATRPVPNTVLIPLIAERLATVGIHREQITILIGTGLHRVSLASEFPQILGKEVASTYRVFSHDANDPDQLVRIGTTSRGTPVVLNKRFVEADRTIALGVLDPHQFAGFAGGAKAVAIGLGGAALISANHAMLTDPCASIGHLDGNPVREDIDEVGKIAQLDFIVNVVLNSQRRIIAAVAGDYLLAHRAGAALARKYLQATVDAPADLVIAASGGHPKDLNLYQAQKALLHACRVVKPGGTVILVARCEEGIGSDKFAETMALGTTIDEVLDKFAHMPFFVGGHKAYLWGMSLKKSRVILVSDGISASEAALMKVEKADTVERAVQMSCSSLPHDPKIVYIPKAPSTIPVIREAPADDESN
ncbi:MAG: nickel-dependent lactate racemase [Sporolactobacillus sp.]